MKKKKGKQKKYKVRMHSWVRPIVIFLIVLFCIAIIVTTIYFVMKTLGKSKLYQKNEAVDTVKLSYEMLEIEEEITNEEIQELEEGQIFIGGKIYQYNEDILTFLCMGIDGGAYGRAGITKEKEPGDGGQADTIVLLVLNPHDKSMKAIAVNRDIMTEISIYDTDGGYMGEQLGQLTLQYAYGNGRERSCELMEKVVSEVFYGIPIHAYVSVDMSTIATLTDAVGGIEVTMPEDMTFYNKAWKEGSKITLQGKDALYFVKYRDYKSEEIGTNLKRLTRQKLYLTAFVNQAKARIKDDLMFPVHLYQDMKSHIVTNLTTDEMTYLASEILGYRFDMDSMIHIDGVYQMGEEFEEYYVDEKELKNTIMEVFYEEVN